MRQFLMIALALALAAGSVHAQQAANSADVDNSSVQTIVKKIIPPKMLNQQPIHISSPDIADTEFAEEARANRINGKCLISFTVDVNGMPQEVKPVRCSDPSFAKSSVATVAKYRFKPATTEDGDPVVYHESVVINYYREGCFDPAAPIRHVFSTPPGVISSDPGADGVYPLTRSVTPPAITRFSDEGYGVAAFNSPEGNGSCDIVLTISATGNASDPQVTHCERPDLEKLAVQSLLKSQYKPGKVNGKAVPVRASIHLEYADIPPKS
jgi:Gram-negative bacterial TonB protein C-terminal